MVSLSPLFFAVVLTTSPGEAVLLDFSADWCDHCRTMAPTIARLEKDGFPVRHVNVDQDRALAQRLGVTGVPCYVLVAQGREIDRVVGAASYDRLTRMFQAAESAAPTGTAANVTVRGQSPEPTTLAARDPFAQQRSVAAATESTATLRPTGSQAPVDLAALPTAATSSLAGQPGGPLAATPMPAAANAPRTGFSDPTQKALAATVRLRIDEGQSSSFGTGTVIDMHGEEALVLTCGHVFRDSHGKGPITVDLFAPGARGAVTGHLLEFDLQRDVAIVSIRPGLAIEPIQVCGANYHAQKGDAVFSIGCDKGGPALVKTSFVAAINKYEGPPNLEVKGAPIDGRSGGGLFSADGRLIGVCNAADKADDEGLYAAAAAVYALLDKANLGFVYQRATPNIPVANSTPAANPVAAPQMAASNGAPPMMPDRMPAGASTAGAIPSGVPATPMTAMPTAGTALANVPPAAMMAALDGMPKANASGPEVICIVRSADPREAARVLVVPQPSSDLLDRLARESQAAGNGMAATEPTSLRGTAGTSPVPSYTFGNNAPSASREPILRGQSGMK